MPNSYLTTAHGKCSAATQCFGAVQNIDRRAIAEAAGATLLEQEDTYRQRVVDRQEPLPESPPQPAQAWIFTNDTAVYTEGDWHEIRVTTVTPEDAAGCAAATAQPGRILGVEDVAWMQLLLARRVGYQNAPSGRSSPTGRRGCGNRRRRISAVPRRAIRR